MLVRESRSLLKHHGIPRWMSLLLRNGPPSRSIFSIPYFMFHYYFPNKNYISSFPLHTSRPGLAIKYEDVLLVLQAIVILLPVHILQTVYHAIMHHRLLRPKTLSYWRVLMVHILYVKLVVLPVVYIID